MRQTLKQFILECLTINEKQDLYGVKRCTAFSLVHVAGANELELKTIKIGAKAHDPKELADLFEGTAENYAGGIPGVQQFVVYAFYDDSTQPQSRYPLRKSADPDHTGLGTEAPTTAGITQQLMRHNEASARITANAQTTIFSELVSMLREERAEVKALRREQTDTIELAKNLILQQAADSHNRELEMMRVKQSFRDREKVMGLLPGLVNKVTGREIFPQATVDSAIFEQLADTLKPEQVEKLAAILEPEQWAFLADRLTKILEKKRAIEKTEDEIRSRAGKVPQIGNGTAEKPEEKAG